MCSSGLKILLLVVVFSLAAVTAMASNALSPESLHYLTEEYYPFNYSQNGVVKGLSVGLLRATWREMGVKPQPIQVVPWARGYKLVQREPGTVLFSMARTEEREAMFQWVGPIYVARFVLIAKRGRDLHIRTLSDLAGLSIGTLREDVSDSLLDGVKSIAKVEAVAKMEQNLAKLLAGRLDLIAYEENSWWRMAERNDLSPDNFEVVYVLKEVAVYYAFHKDTPPALVDRFQQAFDKVRHSPEYQAILDRHLQ